MLLMEFDPMWTQIFQGSHLFLRKFWQKFYFFWLPKYEKRIREAEEGKDKQEAIHRDLRGEGEQRSRGRWITAMIEAVLNYIKKK